MPGKLISALFWLKIGGQPLAFRSMAFHPGDKSFFRIRRFKVHPARLRACLNGSRRREEAETAAIPARSPPPHVGGYGVRAIFKTLSSLANASAHSGTRNA